MRMCIHPDDPPFSLYGLPRIVSTADDARFILNAVDSPANGLTFCTGSYGTRADNDIAGDGRGVRPPHPFRPSAQRDQRGRRLVLRGRASRGRHRHGGRDPRADAGGDAPREEGRADWRIPMRPDHGHLLADDIGKTRINPGYSLIGRLKGLAELRGIMRAVERFGLA